MAFSRVGGPEKGPRGKLIVPGSNRWHQYWNSHPTPKPGRMPVYRNRRPRKGPPSWMVGLGWPDRYSSLGQLPKAARFLSGADLRPLVTSMESSYRGRGKTPPACLLRFRVAGYAGGSPDRLQWVNGGFNLPFHALRRQFLPMSEEALRDWIQQWATLSAPGRDITPPVAISVIPDRG